MDYDAELQLHQVVLRRHLQIGRTDRVLDIGCGSGGTTREAARLAAMGGATGVDVSARMIERARRQTAIAGLRNARYEHGDAQVHPFSADHFDLAISRFGTMFFANPATAFLNIRRALRAGGRLVMMVWQSADLNDWWLSILRALAVGEPQPPLPLGATDAFSLGDPGVVEPILTAAGFTGITFIPVEEPVYYGRDVAAALQWVRGFSITESLLARLEPDARKLALDRLHEEFAVHARAGGVWFESRSWIVAARGS